MLNVVHVHTDPKFISETERFDSRWFKNTVVFIGDRKAQDGVKGEQIVRFAGGDHDFPMLVGVCSESDVVVLYDLDLKKSLLATSLPERVVVAWRFFGYELYARASSNYLSTSSLSFRKRSLASMTIQHLKAVARSIMARTKVKVDPDVVFERAMKRADLFLGLSRAEHEHLAQRWPDLPRFVQLPLGVTMSPRRPAGPKSNVVIVGNNRSIYNNHLDVLDLIETTRHSDDLTFLIPFSYGLEDNYAGEVRRRVSGTRHKIKLLEGFLPKDAYFELVTNARAHVSNSYRQLGMGNILEFLNSGVKIYMNRRNVMFRWLRDLGMRVYTIEDFVADMQSNDLELSPEDRESNWQVLSEFPIRFGAERFFQEFTNAIPERRRVQSLAVPSRTIRSAIPLNAGTKAVS